MSTLSVLWKGFLGFWTSLPGPALHCRNIDISKPKTFIEILTFQV